MMMRLSLYVLASTAATREPESKWQISVYPVRRCEAAHQDETCTSDSDREQWSHAYLNLPHRRGHGDRIAVCHCYHAEVA